MSGSVTLHCGETVRGRRQLRAVHVRQTGAQRADAAPHPMAAVSPSCIHSAMQRMSGIVTRIELNGSGI